MLLLEIPLIFLKGAALQLAGKTASGARNMSDMKPGGASAGEKRPVVHKRRT